MPRSAKGDGCIRHRSDGRWEGKYTVGRDPGTGKQIQKSVYGKTQAEVRKKLREATAAVDEGSYTAPARMTLKAWGQTWLSEYTGNVKDSTRTRYEADFRNHISPAIGAVKLSDLRPDMIQRFINDLSREKGLSAKSIKNCHGLLHHILKQAQALGYVRINAAENCTLPRIEQAEMNVLDRGDMKALLSVLPDNVYGTIIQFALFVGAREGECIGLQWSCVDFDKGDIRIEKQLSRPRAKGESYRFTALKNDKPRTVRPAPFVMKLLKDQRRRQMEERLKAGSLWDDCGFPDLVFTTETGKFLNYNVILRHLRNALKAAGLPEAVRFHDLRHSFVVASLLAGDDVKTVQENAGHYSAAFTLDRYASRTESMKDASARRMQAFIDGLNDG